MSDLRAAIAEKHERREQLRIVASHKGEAAVELMRQQARVGHAKRAAQESVGSPGPVREFFGRQLLEEIEVLRNRIAIAREWEVV